VLGGLQAKGLGATAARQHCTEFGTMVARTGDLSRITRNDAGHPIDPTLDHQTLGLLVAGFARWARTVYLLIGAMQHAT
jgi:hypothetical protein